MTTLAAYWEKLTKEDKEFLLNRLKGIDNMHMGRLPFVNAAFARTAVVNYYSNSHVDAITQSRLAGLLSKHAYEHKTVYKDSWAIPRKYLET